MSFSPHLAPGSVFARDFRVIAPLGQGGMGVVYRAEQLSTGRQRALKLLLAAAADPALLRRFEQEARVGALIQSDHIVEVVAAGVDDATGLPWLAMELLDGRDLAAHVRESGPLSPEHARSVLQQLLGALAAAHAAGVVHRDLKPENLFLASPRAAGAAPLLKVLDFGIAKVMGASTLGQTAAVGTPLWMAPEQTDHGVAIRPSTDVWALGLLAFYLFTGRPYWRTANEPTGSPVQLMRELLLDPLPPASARASLYGAAARLPEGFDGWFARCIDRDPTARFASAGEAFDALQPLSLPALTPHSPSALTRSQPTLAPVAVAHAPAAFAFGPTQPSPSALTPQPAQGPSPTPRSPLALSSAPLPAPPTPAPPTPAPFQPATPQPTGQALGLPPPPIVDPPRPAPRSPYPVLVAGALVALVWGASLFFYRPAWVPPRVPASSPLPSASPSASLQTSTQTDPKLGLVMVQFPAHQVWVGSDDLELERPRHPVSVGPFAIDAIEVLVAHYRQCVDAGACAAPESWSPLCNWGKPDRLGHPVNCVDALQAAAFCKWAGKRLPTEQEWEAAARGVEQRVYPWGPSPPDAGVCWNHPERLTGAGPGTCLVGTSGRDTTPQGIADLGGNVAEWTSSAFCPYTRPDCGQPLRVVRGASFAQSTPTAARGGYRLGMPPDARGHMGLGFRCAR